MVRFLGKHRVFSYLIASLLSVPLVSVLAMEDSEIEKGAVSAKSILPQTQADVNNSVISTAKKVYELINLNWRYVPSGPHQKMQTESAFWDPKWIMVEGIFVPTLILKTSPDTLMDALQDLVRKPARLECTIALTIVKIFCLRELFGVAHFNHYASEFFKILQTDSNFTPEDFFHELPNQFLMRVVGEAARPGSITYLTNLPSYSRFKPRGNARGSNVVCIAPGQYLGFSAIYKSGPQSLEVIESQDFDLYCDPIDVERNHTEHAQLSQTYKEKHSLFVESRRDAQKKWIFTKFLILKH